MILAPFWQRHLSLPTRGTERQSHLSRTTALCGSALLAVRSAQRHCRLAVQTRIYTVEHQTASDRATKVTLRTIDPQAIDSQAMIGTLYWSNLHYD